MLRWVPWMFIGGAAFAILSFIIAKYQDKPRAASALAQDFIGGAVVIAMLGALTPDSFPEVTLPAVPALSQFLPSPADADLQVGPIR